MAQIIQEFSVSTLAHKTESFGFLPPIKVSYNDIFKNGCCTDVVPILIAW